MTFIEGKCAFCHFLSAPRRRTVDGETEWRSALIFFYILLFVFSISL